MDISELKKICQKEHYDDLHQVVVRKYSIYFTKLLVKYNITANQLSIINVFIGIAASLIFLLPAGIHWFLIPVMLVLVTILDHTDGEIARFRKESSLTGLFVDRLLPVTIFPFILICIAIRLSWDIGSIVPLIYGALGAWTTCLMRYLRASVAHSFSDAIRNPLKATISQQQLKQFKGKTINIDGLGSTGAKDTLLKRLIYFASSIIIKGLGISIFILLCIFLYLNKIYVLGLDGLYIFLILNFATTFLADIYLIRLIILNKTPDRLFVEYLRNHE
ncbi:MAG: CDP-alcohol phosphatidyltransferase family protein [Candidatus Marinimicrobia bacterium]|nr:CDP-alcohol phosphatidyltransferase family protein [Candidatus Neomarinimicrobiota bacterium]